MSRAFVAGLLIFAFIGVIILSVNFVQSIDPSGNTVREHFTTAPTRAANCQCLPGYIPSVNRLGGTVYMDTGVLLRYGVLFFSPSGTKDFYGVAKDDSCGISYTDTEKYTKLTRENMHGFTFSSYRGLLTCDKLNRNTKNYFCQSLSNPSKTRKCY
jgi:hypothetical protein